ncbi:MAG TPA: carbohydrate-binding protein, partial [Herpetosiphonaceae bacterium]|nr:carbohydrate-binding protein [Herpetosiphonaceae bacterium]
EQAAVASLNTFAAVVGGTGAAGTLSACSLDIGGTPTPTPTSTPAPAQGPYGGTARAIPGTIQAEDFDTGGEGVAYHDTEAANQGGQYRAGDGVDIEAATDNGGGFNIGWIGAGEWLEYTVNVQSAGDYTLTARVASNATTGSLRAEFGGIDKTGAIAIGSTGGWQAWANRSKTVSLGAGQQVLRIFAVGGDFNLNSITLSSGGATPTPTNTPVPPGGYAPAFCGSYPPAIVAGSWQSSVVSYSNGRLQYAADSARNRIPDFSYAGYYSGERALPNVPAVQTLGPASGDNTARIQQALDAIGNRTPDANGFRGALLLSPGRYAINGTLRINKSGVVLRGSGDGSDPATSTILAGVGNTPHQRTLVIVGNGDSTPWTAGSATNVTDQFVQVGSRTINVADPSRFSVGQEVIVRHPSSQAWINAVSGGGVVSDAWWAAGSLDITWTRRVTRIAGTALTLDAPVFNHLDRALAQATVAPVSNRNIIGNAGLESLRIDIQTAGGEDENHVWDAIGVIGAENSWVKNATVLHFGHAGVFTMGAIRITVEDVQALDPVGIRTGGRFYNFDAESNSQLVLFTRVHGTGGRHHFISNGTQSTSGIVWHRSTEGGGSDSEGHRQWSQGLLFDTINASAASNINLINRGDYGTSHGWGNVHSVVWNYNRTMMVQKPPTAQNYVISQSGTRSTSHPFPGAGGFADIRSGTLLPNSLYEAQLCDRLEN